MTDILVHCDHFLCVLYNHHDDFTIALSEQIPARVQRVQLTSARSHQRRAIPFQLKAHIVELRYWIYFCGTLHWRGVGPWRRPVLHTPYYVYAAPRPLAAFHEGIIAHLISDSDLRGLSLLMRDGTWTRINATEAEQGLASVCENA
jgi:hypothetical protein